MPGGPEHPSAAQKGHPGTVGQAAVRLSTVWPCSRTAPVGAEGRQDCSHLSTVSEGKHRFTFKM